MLKRGSISRDNCGGGGFQSDFFHNVMQQHIFFYKKIRDQLEPHVFYRYGFNQLQGKTEEEFRNIPRGRCRD